MTTTVGIRELSRNSNILDGYDYIDIEDKRTHEYKGLFVSPKYAEEFKRFLKEKEAKEIKEQLDEIMSFVGSNEMKDKYKGLEGKELMREVAKDKCGR